MARPSHMSYDEYLEDLWERISELQQQSARNLKIAATINAITIIIIVASFLDLT